MEGFLPHYKNCHYLLIFNVGENNFSGNIPKWIPHGAKALHLRSNKFSSSIPTQMCQMSSLIILDIANNTISGHIPTCLHNITALVFNNASLNKLSFEFPTIDTLGIVDNPYYALVDSLELVTKGQVSNYAKEPALYELN